MENTEIENGNFENQNGNSGAPDLSAPGVAATRVPAQEAAPAAAAASPEASDASPTPGTDAPSAELLSAMASDPNFRLFVGDRAARVPFVRLYADYLALCGGIREAERARAAAILANTRATPGALAGQGPAAEPYFSREEVARMSGEQVHRYYDRIRESMAHWN